MSRSKKKPIIKDKQRFFQKLGNRILRNRAKQMIGKQQDDKLPMRKKEVVNDYDVSDYKFIVNKKSKVFNYEKAKRK